MTRFDSICNICGSREFRNIATRSDGVPVIACLTCSHAVVEHFPYDMEHLYGEGYFTAAWAGRGYAEYDYTAGHSVAWAAALVRLLRPSGRILDVGCANGHLLRKLAVGYERYGIEPNAAAARDARSAGIEIIGSDILDHGLKQRYAEYFDAVLAIAVFEHVTGFKAAVQAALDLLKPGGLLIFEVPLITGDLRPDTWFRTSLEHIHYPTEQSLHYLFERVLGLELAGAALEVKDFAYIYTGVVSKSSAEAPRLADDLRRWTTAPPASLSPAEGRFRFLLDVIHAADPTPEVLALQACLDPCDFNPLMRRRMFELWSAEVARRVSIEGYLWEVEKARDWHASETNKLRDLYAELRDLYAESVRFQSSISLSGKVRDLARRARAWLDPSTG
jgi:O-antigen biosynthesis protein